MAHVKWMLAVLLTCLILAGCLAIAVASGMDGITIDKTNFPDSEFCTYIHTVLDKDQDGILSAQEIEQTVEINLTGVEVENLNGIEFFWNLKRLICFSHKGLTELDVSRNTNLTTLDCSECSIVSLTLNTALTVLHCMENQLATLDVSPCSNLRQPSCNSNQLKELDVSKNPVLEILDCDDNQLAALDISQNQELTELSCSRNQLIMLDVSKNRKLVYLSCSSNLLTSLDVSKNTALMDLFCYNNQIFSLDTSRNLDMEILDCASNRLSSLVVNKQLYELDSSENCLLLLDLSENTNLNFLRLSDQQAEIEVTQNAENEWGIDLAAVVDNWDDYVTDVRVGPDGVQRYGSVVSWNNQRINPVISYRYDTRALELEQGVAGVDPYMNVVLVLRPVISVPAPQTGDPSNPAVLMLLAATALVGIAALLALWRHTIYIR